jgi:periplasmic protein TonB
LNIIVFDPATPPQRIRVEGSEYKAKLIEKTTPGHLGEGAPDTCVVKLAVVIGKDGTVIDIDPLAGTEPLISSAVDAVRGWKYKPTLLNGRPVKIETTVDAAFPLDK